MKFFRSGIFWGLLALALAATLYLAFIRPGDQDVDAIIEPTATPALTRSWERRSSARRRSSWRRSFSRSARTETNCPADSATRTRRDHSRSRSRSSSIAEYKGRRATRAALARLPPEETPWLSSR